MFKGRLLGLCGYSKVGKDMLAGLMKGWKRFAFADPLKHDLKPLLDMVGLDLDNVNHKEIARPLLVEWGRTARRVDKLFWVKRTLERVAGWLDANPDGKAVLSDVRYANEVGQILALGGQVVRLFRPHFGPVNSEEGDSIIDIDMNFQLPGIVNDRDPQWLLDQVWRVANHA